MTILEKIAHFIERLLEKFYKRNFGVPNKPKEDELLMKYDHFYIYNADIIYGNDDLTGPRNVKKTVSYEGAGKKSKFEVDFFVMLFHFNGADYLLAKTDSLFPLDDSCFCKFPAGYVFNFNRSDKEISLAAQDIMTVYKDKKKVKYRNQYIAVINGTDYGKMYYNEFRKGFDTGDIVYDDYTEFKFDYKESNKGALVPVNGNESWNPEHGISIEGRTSDFSSIINSSKKGGAVFDMYFSGRKGEGLIYDYTLIVNCQGPTGIFNYLKLWFIDETGDKYSLMVYSSSRQDHTIHFNSNEPNIKRVEYEFSL